METGADGATVSQFKIGMQKYVKRQGYNVSYGSLMSWGSFKYDSAKIAVQAGKPIALFIKNTETQRSLTKTATTRSSTRSRIIIIR